MIEPISTNFGQQLSAIIDQKGEVPEYISKKKELYNIFILLLEKSDNTDSDYQSLFKLLQQQNQKKNRAEIEQFLQLINDISNNMHREESIFKNLYRIIELNKTQIKDTFSNDEIFDIFENNKKILLFLFKKEIITINDYIYEKLVSKTEANGNHYRHFFYPEIKKFIGDEKAKDIEKELIEKDSNIFHRFEEKREEGENEGLLCSYIREDSVEKFVSYVTLTNMPLEVELLPSIFETNSFLIENKNPTLIEYAAFFGAIQIFQYLKFNDVKSEPSLWLYAIHSRNAEMIHLIESCQVGPPNKGHLCESIKCHHNEITNYIENNLMTDDNDDKLKKSKKVISAILKFHNYAYFPSDFENAIEFFYLCAYNYHTLVKLYIMEKSGYLKEEASKTTIQQATEQNQFDIAYYLLMSQSTICKNDFYNNTKIKRIVIPPSITSIVGYSFWRCESLKEIVIPSSVTSIEGYSFYGCIKLKTVIIPPSVTSIGDYAFWRCYPIENIIIPSSVTSIGEYAFWRCESLIEVIIPPHVTSIRNKTFYGCSSLKRISIPSSVILIENFAFWMCESLREITIPPLVTSIGEYAFYNCKLLKEIIIPSSVTSIGQYAFWICDSLGKATILSTDISIQKFVFPYKTKIIKIL